MIVARPVFAAVCCSPHLAVVLLAAGRPWSTALMWSGGHPAQRGTTPQQLSDLQEAIGLQAQYVFKECSTPPRLEAFQLSRSPL